MLVTYYQEFMHIIIFKGLRGLCVRHSPFKLGVSVFDFGTIPIAGADLMLPKNP